MLLDCPTCRKGIHCYRHHATCSTCRKQRRDSYDWSQYLATPSSVEPSTIKYHAFRRFWPHSVTPVGKIWRKFFMNHERVSDEEFRFLWRSYMNSPQWIARRSLVLQRARGTCEHCHNAPAEEIHHLHYTNRFNEPLEDLLGVCSPCHRFFSKKGANPVRTDSHRYEGISEDVAISHDHNT